MSRPTHGVRCSGWRDVVSSKRRAVCSPAVRAHAARAALCDAGRPPAGERACGRRRRGTLWPLAAARAAGGDVWWGSMKGGRGSWFRGKRPALLRRQMHGGCARGGTSGRGGKDGMGGGRQTWVAGGRSGSSMGELPVEVLAAIAAAAAASLMPGWSRNCDDARAKECR